HRAQARLPVVRFDPAVLGRRRLSPRPRDPPGRRAQLAPGAVPGRRAAPPGRLVERAAEAPGRDHPRRALARQAIAVSGCRGGRLPLSRLHAVILAVALLLAAAPARAQGTQAEQDARQCYQLAEADPARAIGFCTNAIES